VPVTKVTSRLQAGELMPAGAPPDMGVVLPNTLERAQTTFNTVFSQQIRATWQATGTTPPAGASPHELLLGTAPLMPAADFIAAEKLDMGSFDPIVRGEDGAPSLGPDGQPITWQFRDLGNNRYALTDPNGSLSPWTAVYDFNAGTVAPVDSRFGGTQPILTTDMSQSQKTNLKIAWDLARKFDTTPEAVLANVTDDHQFKTNPLTLWGAPRTT
jgi:hypothetical protein